ncbi:glycerol-3-phosphate dehydrogenase/oxidase [Demequina activiva]|uniref:Glycerol-3-phosphate dehydrogenase n=1 Tax=Demequina activiva TaxID=1582364 RepID=A0A919Q0X1_9MICO|nr:glycerol-3-phosphate dehydrogenase/oxidase [Demequina activiva]GIG54112.1 glycerol-3-phosphate dehydrogenase [Demequina activiva]
MTDRLASSIAGGARPTVLVIGGGINGLAVFRDLCLQGVDAVLVERGDISAGASAASSRMVHGGLRYLEYGELRLVRESVQERNRLLRNAAHHVAPLPTTIPLRRYWSGLLTAPLRLLRLTRSAHHSERGAVLVKVGLLAYDAFSGAGGPVPRHEFRGRRRSHQMFPALAPEVRCTATYFDAAVAQPERVAIDLLRDALEANPRSRAVTYAEVTGVEPEGAVVTDAETGETVVVDANVIVNASGPWTDLTNAALGEPTAWMGGTKGSHIVVDHPELLAATGGHEMFFEHADGRIVLIHPMHGRVMIGTTDIPADPREPARCTEDEVQYFLDLVADVFPGITVEPAQIVYRFAGIRPLPRADRTAPGAVSRDYRIETSEDAQGRLRLSIVGGKWTTFRALGERVADQVLEAQGLSRLRDTRDVAIGGARGLPLSADDRLEWAADHLAAAEPGRRDELLRRYGTRAPEVLDHLRDGEDHAILGDRLSIREVDYLVAAEHARTVSDILQRRTSLAFEGRVTREVVERVADAMAPRMGWDEAQRARQVARCVSELADGHGVEIGSPVG